jgi:DNA (cytosine-5)-methyltransferase 1
MKDLIKHIMASAIHISTTKLGIVNRNKENEYHGRANIENIHQLNSSGFVAGARFTVDSSHPDAVTFKLTENGERVVTPKENKRRDGSVVIGSRIDVRSELIASKLPDPNNVVVYYLDGMIVLMPTPSDLNNAKRINKLKLAIENNDFKTAAVYSGFGGIDDSLHEGFELNGLSSKLVFATDIWSNAIDALYENNAAATKKTKTAIIGIEQLCAMGMRPFEDADMITFGIPCKGSSKLNTATRDMPEMHPLAGHQVLNLVMLMQSMSWDTPIVLVENVTAWANAVSCSMLKRVFEEQGYQVEMVGDYSDGKYKGINSLDYGSIERRVRMGMLAYPKGVNLDMSLMKDLATGPSKLTVGDIRFNDDEIDMIEYEYGKHLDSEAKKSKGWQNRVCNDTDNVTPSMSAECYKQRIEDPRFKHQTIEGKSRLPLPEEHAALKGHPLRLINSLTFKTHAHVALGNSCARNPFVAFGYALSKSLIQIFAPNAPTKTTFVGEQGVLFN